MSWGGFGHSLLPPRRSLLGSYRSRVTMDCCSCWILDTTQRSYVKFQQVWMFQGIKLKSCIAVYSSQHEIPHCSCRTCTCTGIPLEGSSVGISGFSQSNVVQATLRIGGYLARHVVVIDHADFLAVIRNGCSWQQQHQHVKTIDEVFGIAASCSFLVVITDLKISKYN